jgi:ABC-type Fe3+ transport system substrate-binding protein
MLKKIGVFDQIENKLVRLWDGTAVMRHLIEGKANEFGFGGITDILGYRDQGLRLVGPLPAEIQNYASYSAAVIAAAPNPDAAKAFMAYLASADGRALFAANGIPQWSGRGPARRPERGQPENILKAASTVMIPKTTDAAANSANLSMTLLMSAWTRLWAIRRAT